MRVTSDLYASALVRCIFTEGGFAAVSKRGAPEAGAVFVLVDRLDGSFDFYGPAPQAMFTAPVDGRLFEPLLSKADREQVDDRLGRESRIDPDYWVIEVEARDGRIDLPLAEDEAPENPADRYFKL
nr:DUF1491 family protein [Roseibium denhamense]